MMKLMRAPNLLIGQHWINVLATAGIACELHNRYLNGALGEIPADQCAPELWLVDERDETMARKLITVLALQPVRRDARSAVYGVLAMRDRAQSA
jgi:hypothetical protein